MSDSASSAVQELSSGQYSAVYNLLSLAIASLLFTALFLLLSRGQVAARYRGALIVSATVCGIATYHYFRIFENFKESYPPGETVDAAHMLSNVAFNEGYRYVDWFLTVPLLLVETVAVLALSSAESRKLLLKLVPAAALMIALGYPGEVTLDTGPRVLFGILSTIPFIYLLYVLFVELGRAIEGRSQAVQRQISVLRWVLVVSWLTYPIAYSFPLIGGEFFEGAGGFVLRNGGYSIADIVAKAVFGLLIYRLARTQSIEAHPEKYGDMAEDAVESGSRQAA